MDSNNSISLTPSIRLTPYLMPNQDQVPDLQRTVTLVFLKREYNSIHAEVKSNSNIMEQISRFRSVPDLLLKKQTQLIDKMADIITQYVPLKKKQEKCINADIFKKYTEFHLIEQKIQQIDRSSWTESEKEKNRNFFLNEQEKLTNSIKFLEIELANLNLEPVENCFSSCLKPIEVLINNFL